MTLEKKIQIAVENAIPLDPKCALTRSQQMERRAALRLQIEALFREYTRPQGYEPRTELKYT